MRFGAYFHPHPDPLPSREREVESPLSSGRREVNGILSSGGRVRVTGCSPLSPGGRELE